MKLLHTTDLHFRLHWFEWIEKQQKNFDVFCISGDLLEPTLDTPMQEQIEWITKWIKAFQKPLFICSGNHDIEVEGKENWLCEIDTSNYYSDNVIKTIDGITIGCCAYIKEDDFMDFSSCDIVLNHLPPAKTTTSTDKNGNDWGDKELYSLIKSGYFSPKYILCGHMHHPLQITDTLKNTKVYNPGVDKKKKIPNHFAIKLL